MPSQTRRGQGQWAMGHLEPLNAAERFKKDDSGLNVRDRIINRYAHLGFDSIDPADLRGRFRWWGLYTQRAPGIEGGRTGALQDEEIEDSYFMMRVRIPGGQLTAHQLRTVAGIATGVRPRPGRRHRPAERPVPLDPDRGRPGDLVAAGGRRRCPPSRPAATCRATSWAARWPAWTTPRSWTPPRSCGPPRRWRPGNPELANLPRKFKTAISGCASHCTPHEVNDVSFVGVIGPDGTPGFDLWVGGGLSTNPMIAQRLGVFVRPDQVPAVWTGVATLFRDYGYRRLRARARIKFLVADWGAAKFREVLEKEYLGEALPDGPAPVPAPATGRDHVGVHRQQDGNYYVGVAPHVGRTSGTQLAHVADLAQTYGSGTVRTTTEQKLLILDIPERALPGLLSDLEAADLQARPSVFRRGTMACTGIEFCKLAIVETKGRARDLYTELARRLPDFDTPITINVNGCPNSCARFQLADIGLKGSIVDGQEGFQIHLGGSLGAEPGFGRKARGLKVTSADLTDYVERLLRNYQSDRAPDEPFATWARRADEKLLA